MRSHRLVIPCFLALALAWIGPSAAQTAPAGDTAQTGIATRTDRKIERIKIEDAGSRIDELRVGGETQSIMVSPKGGMPAYDVLPESGNRNLARGERSGSGSTGGTRVWKVFGF